jgi:hypothetical protein
MQFGGQTNPNPCRYCSIAARKGTALDEILDARGNSFGNGATMAVNAIRW